MNIKKKQRPPGRKKVPGSKDSEEILQRLTGGPLNIGRALAALRLSDEISQAEFARLLSIPRQHLNDIEKGRRSVSLLKAVAFARALGQPEVVFIQLALQTLVDESGLRVQVRVAS
jgi:DNA-binding XRE family transcriptional regulator